LLLSKCVTLTSGRKPGRQDTYATGAYPPWWEGRRFTKPNVAWCAGVTGEQTRDAVQRRLLGRQSQIGTGSLSEGSDRELDRRERRLMTNAANAPGKQPRGRPWRLGQSGNPRGKAPRTLHHATRSVLALLDGEADALTRKAIELALAGDTTALQLCLERLAAPAKDRPIRLSLPSLAGVGDAPMAAAAVVEAMTAGEITPSEAAAAAGVIDAYRKSVEIAELEARLARLEEQLEHKR
jgi:hypothetical protein